MTDAEAADTTLLGYLLRRSPLRLHSSGVVIPVFGRTTLRGDSRPYWEQFDHANLWPVPGVD